MRETHRSHMNTDVSSLVSDLKVPTLVLDRRDNRALRDLAAGGRALSRLIPGAQLAQTSNQAEMAQLVLEFLHQEPTETLGAFRTIMFTDLVSSTAITQRIGDDAAQRIVETHDACVQQALSTHAGTMVKHTGDGIMAAFNSATEAAQAARQIAATLSSTGVGVRIGLNAGEPVERDGDFFGTAVQLAARLGDAAEEGQVLATQVVRDLTAGKGLDWSAATPIAAKGFDEPIKVFNLRIPDKPPT